MSQNFDWYSEEDGRWQTDPPPPPPPLPLPRWPLLLGITAVLLIAGAFLIYRQAAERAREIEAAVSADVQAAHAFLRDAVANKDSDLFRVGLSGRIPEWAETQTTLMRLGRLWEREPLGLLLLSAEADDGLATAPEIVIYPDLSAAEVVYTLPYRVDGAQTMLQHTAVYRRGEGRWLYAPPDDDFWGSQITNRGKHLTLIYRQRDAELLEKLAFDLDQIMLRLCANSPALQCPTNGYMEVSFSTEPDSLIGVFDLRGVVQSGRQLTLPTPTLLGLPVDEISYQGVLRGYATYITLAFTADLTNYTCCRGGLLFRALVDWQLYQAGLDTWPMTPDLYGQLLQAGVERSTPSMGWQSDDLRGRGSNWTAVYALVHYLAEVHGQDMGAMQREVSGRLMGWLRDAGLEVQGQYTDWVGFIYANTNFGNAPLPESDLNLFCRANFTGEHLLYRYDFAASEWRELIHFPNRGAVPGVTAVDMPNTLFLSEYNQTLGIGYASLWQNGTQIPLYDPLAEQIERNSYYYSVTFLNVDPQQRYLAFMVTISQRLSGQVQREVRLVDLQSCTASGCQYRQLPAPPVWSPGGKHMLLYSEEGLVDQGVPKFPLYMADDKGENLTQVGEGLFPFWLDDEVYGYLRWPDLDDTPFWEQETIREEMLPQMVSAVMGENVPQLMVSSAQMRAALPPDLENPPDFLFAYQVKQNPGRLGEYLLRAVPISIPFADERQYFFWWRQSAAQQPRLTFIEGVDRAYEALFSSNGRYLQILLPPKSATTPNESLLLNLETGQLRTLLQSVSSPYEAWSPDGRWLMLPQANYILLYAPDEDNFLLVMTELPNCNPPFWSRR